MLDFVPADSFNLNDGYICFSCDLEPRVTRDLQRVHRVGDDGRSELQVILRDGVAGDIGRGTWIGDDARTNDGPFERVDPQIRRREFASECPSSVLFPVPGKPAKTINIADV